MSENDLYKALNIVYLEAIKEAERHERAMQSPPLYGWSAEKHALYHSEARARWLIVSNSLFARMMQISPD